MSSGLGVAIGSTNSTAAVCPVEHRNDRDAGLPVTSYPTLLRLSADAPPVLGARRVRSATAATAALRTSEPELTRYETAVPGLYLTGAATFPGAGIWGASGRNCATVILARLP